MITCSVCGQENDDLHVTCSRCKSYIQSKVDNLDLFGTIWMLIENPRSAMKRIVLARHKNYIILLSALFGVALVYSLLWSESLGPRFSSLLTLVSFGIIVGPVLGVVFVSLASAVVAWIDRLAGGKGTWRALYAVLSYSAFPIIFSLVFVYPIEIAIFGSYFFDKNPPPMVINPAAYVILIGLDVLAVVWSGVLLVQGTRVATTGTRTRAMLLSLIVFLLAGSLVFATAKIVRSGTSNSVQTTGQTTTDRVLVRHGQERV